MRALFAVLACVAFSSATWSAPWVPPVRDGAWLQNGIKLKQRWNAHETLSDQELSDATLVASYVCAVVDFEKELAQRAATLLQALQSGNPKKRVDPRLLAGMTQAVPILVPLANRDFLANGPSCERASVIVQEATEKVNVRPYADLRNLGTVQVLTGGTRK